MSDELPDVPSLRRMDPPLGGLAMLRDRLDRAERSRGTRWLLLAVPAFAIVALWFVLRQPASHRPVATIEMPAPAPAPVADRHVGESFYWVDSTPTAGPAHGTPIETVTVEQRAIALPPIIP